ncbi:hypothetical protein [Paenibacillus sp. DMB20]|uniref:hypothetical protein n=1 Tax=Paenibacillus sp. DMB20 TaxID=1642570 RepID=UPI000627694D|nr:hypothetical protein [Paenibacillus sp. DMB20]KKO54107.1 hypothetical protein XI25_08495 [Paenibacillus sp. DMB20]
MERMLLDRGSGKTWSLKRIGHQVLTSANGGKEREKSFDNPEQAAKHAEKEVWSRLKKGFILSNLEAKPGEPVLQLYIGSGYTGSMPIAPIPGTNRFYLGYVVGSFEKEQVYLMDEHGVKRHTYELAGNHLIYDMRYCPEAGELLINDSHQIRGLSIDNGALRDYGSRARHPVSTLALSGSRAVWYDEPNLVVHDLLNQRELYRVKAECELYGGHSPQLCAALSHSGDMLAFCANGGEISIWDLPAKRETIIAKSSNAMTASMFFSPDDRFLFTQERYGTWELKRYDLGSMEACGEWSTGSVKSCAADAGKGLVAVFNYGKISLYHMLAKECILEFKVEHVVKNCSMAFTKDYLAVYTDYGCVSLYKI